MRIVVQRVLEAKVEVNKEVVGEIGKGIVVLAGFEEQDTEKDFEYVRDKVMGLRIFEDENEKMNLSVKDIDGGMLVVPNFTLYGDVRKGKRPSFIQAAKPEKARKFYNEFTKICKQSFDHVQTGIFQADMKVTIINDGPVTIMLDSKKLF